MANAALCATAPVVPFSFRTTEIRTVVVDNEVWFVASDVAKALNYAEAKDMTRVLDDDEKGRHNMPTPSGDQDMIVINESGVYHAVIKSRKPEAKPFRKWVTAEVLPAIRKTGSYIPDAPITAAQAGELATRIAERFPEGKHRPYAWSRFNNHFRISGYKTLPAARYAEALAYIDQMPVKPPALPTPTDPVLIAASAELTRVGRRFVATFHADPATGELLPVLSALPVDAYVLTPEQIVAAIADPGAFFPRRLLPALIQAAAARLPSITSKE